MCSIRILGALTAVAITSILAFAGCTTGADATCNDLCDKAESCGDVDSVKAEQCRKWCDGHADTEEAVLDACINSADILSATYQCLDRSCSDYSSCLTTVPACKGGWRSRQGL